LGDFYGAGVSKPSSASTDVVYSGRVGVSYQFNANWAGVLEGAHLWSPEQVYTAAGGTQNYEQNVATVGFRYKF
jgi:hypothetical protein